MVSHLSGSDATPGPLCCYCVLGHRRLAPTVVTVAVVITSTLIAAIGVAVPVSLPDGPLVTYFFWRCPKHVGSFGYSTDFLRGRRSVGSDIDFVRKNMSLVYAKKSDEIGCVFHVCFACFYMRP